jgi:hypothetical protein
MTREHIALMVSQVTDAVIRRTPGDGSETDEWCGACEAMCDEIYSRLGVRPVRRED